MKKTTGKAILHFIRSACVYYTVLNLLFNAIIFLSEGDSANFFSPKGMLCCLLFSVLLTLCEKIFSLEKLPFPALVFFHYCGCALSFLLSFFALGGTQSWPIFLALTILYVLIAIPFTIVHGVKEKKKTEKEEYKSLYSR